MVFDVLIHTGAEHPNLVWVLLPAFITFVLGIGVGVFATRQRSESESATEAQAQSETVRPDQ
ncbi:hypothetical protein OB955_18230 [Halobacteria archaeon AArc-m2/3/4]|uniref:Uncharacterized protein n=1 Tax=Natronoglomus mannanivorans TaxID=2979990 RepID=A0AAP2Z526_9EURY|nr:hypothetical protein [Halobacteria archaeon AArc-xg1-1]MCU4974660.1 hypothetical protein [Halobacteria archaeon AArc-m2/3/4]